MAEKVRARKLLFTVGLLVLILFYMLLQTDISSIWISGSNSLLNTTSTESNALRVDDMLTYSANTLLSEPRVTQPLAIGRSTSNTTVPQLFESTTPLSSTFASTNRAVDKKNMNINERLEEQILLLNKYLERLKGPRPVWEKDEPMATMYHGIDLMSIVSSHSKQITSFHSKRAVQRRVLAHLSRRLRMSYCDHLPSIRKHL